MSDLERMLVALGAEVEVPGTPDLAPSVVARLAPRRRDLRRPLAVALATVLVAALVATLAIPDARSAVLRFFGIGGVSIELVDDLPDVRADPVELELMLGERVPLAEAVERAGFPLLELDQAPDAVYLGERGTVWFVYGRPGSVRLLVAQSPNVRVDEPSLFKKLAAGGTSVDEVTVRGEDGYFLSGEPHLVFLVDEVGEVDGESARLAQEVLVWTEGGMTVRLEGDLTTERAIAIAEQLRVRSPG